MTNFIELPPFIYSEDVNVKSGLTTTNRELQVDNLTA